ncbi:MULTISPECIES: 1-aminocyclopropane-1-carboxylate deaminase/D-cysteine desulfhydrase [unclassified Streptomyces]|uniref:1-aminocyclopropane-1-carboxylate deaminase/D-cysteine desulfhydrase n=1 Tax=unclassified Streptomyces TaxID=2593676 RepID=UPI000DAEC3A8|nr:MULTISPECIES: pyridoxal-phosphate dependent enzyme [unclassified Streptomyces]PZT72148.1 hypothetical protein DNK55_26590 [Streptomyces sp. AC1-42T]PZT81531.1 hypothetical protein DNK56_04985 [Streptomyces sp. AC1-42W]
MNAGRLAGLLPGAAIPVPVPGGRLPTPLDERRDLAEDLGAPVWLKREDLFDDLGSGHKARKLAYVAADAVRRGVDVLVTGGSLPSGQCVAVAAEARRLGIECHVVYCGDEQVKPARPQGSYLVTLLLGPRVSWHERTPWARIEELLAAAAHQERERGRRPQVIPPGLNAWPGILGSIDLGVELAGQLAAAPEGADDVQVVTAAGSGTTCLGLSIAARLLGLRWTVHGMCIGGSADTVRHEVARLREEAAGLLGDATVRGADVTVHGASLGAGYDRPTDAELETMRGALRRHRLLLDPNYMVKAYGGMRDALRTGALSRDVRTVLVHTGGGLGIHGDSPVLQDWYARSFAEFLAPRPSPHS